jgi:hypothetical protein
MWKIVSFVVAAGAVTLLAGACASSGGLSEGGECGGTSDSCGGNLTCVPIEGRGHSYCCPTPTESSKEDNCHPTTQSYDRTPL